MSSRQFTLRCLFVMLFNCYSCLSIPPTLPLPLPPHCLLTRYWNQSSAYTTIVSIKRIGLINTSTNEQTDKRTVCTSCFSIFVHGLWCFLTSSLSPFYPLFTVYYLRDIDGKFYCAVNQSNEDYSWKLFILFLLFQQKLKRFIESVCFSTTSRLWRTRDYYH